MTGSSGLVTLALAAATVVSQAADAGVSFTLQGKSAAGSDCWPVTRGSIAAFGDGGGFGNGRVSIGLADIAAGRNLVGPGAANACYAPLPGFPVQNGCLHAKALGVRFEGARLCLALQPGSNLQNLSFSRVVCAPSDRFDDEDGIPCVRRSLCRAHRHRWDGTLLFKEILGSRI